MYEKKRTFPKSGHNPLFNICTPKLNKNANNTFSLVLKKSISSNKLFQTLGSVESERFA